MMQPEYVSRAKADLWWRLNGQNWSRRGALDSGSLPGNLAEAGSAIKTRLNAAFEQRVSASLLVVGPEGSGKNFIVELALATLQRENSKRDKSAKVTGGDDHEHEEVEGVSVARVQGQVDSDHHALCHIAYQLCKREAKDRNVVVALEDLEDHFKQCYLNGTPAVIVLEDIDIFATREKQVLIYTLLDFMHRKDQLLVVIGTTSKAHLPTLLEKRTASRLNAQFVYVAPASSRDICQLLSSCLTLATDDQDNKQEKWDKEPQSEVESESMNMSDSVTELCVGKTFSAAEREYRHTFNRVVRHLFGAPPEPASEVNLSSTGDQGVGEGTLNQSNFSGSVGTSINKKRPALEGQITAYCEWGKGLEHFLRVARLAVSTLRAPDEVPSGGKSSTKGMSTSTTYGPHLLSTSMFEKALFSQDAPSLVERLVCLPWLELHLFAVVSRLYAQKNGMVLVSSTEAANERRKVGGTLGNNNSNSNDKINNYDSGIGSSNGADGSHPRIGGLKTAGQSHSFSRMGSKRKENHMTVSMVVEEMDRLTGVLEKKNIPEERVIQALIALASEESLLVLTNGTGKPSSTRHVTNRTLVLLIPSYHEIRDAFMVKEGTGHHAIATSARAGINCGYRDRFGDRPVGRASPRLVITDRVRRAVLEPLEVIHADAALGL